MGVEIECSLNGCPPVTIQAKGIKGGEALISGKISSQYLSAMLMAAPFANNPTVIKIKDTLVSTPYVRMTMGLMKKFGVGVNFNEEKNEFSISPAQYRSPHTVFVEGDASSASYFLAAAAISGGHIIVQGCGKDSIQGDVRFADILKRMGAKVTYGANFIQVIGPKDKSLNGVDEDCGDIPDVAMTLAIVGLFAQGKTIIRNIYNWRVKETDRMTAMVTEFRKLGATVEEGEDYLIVHGFGNNKTLKSNIEIDTYDDHRMAMCFSLIAFGNVPVTIVDPNCTSKTFPEYFDNLFRLAKLKS